MPCDRGCNAGRRSIQETLVTSPVSTLARYPPRSSMRKLLSWLGTSKPRKARRLAVEWLEDRLTPAGNILVTTAGSGSSLQVVKEFTPAGTQVRQLTVGSG